MRRCRAVVLLLASFPAVLGAQAPNDSTMTPEQFLATLAPTSGRVTVGKDLATLNVPDNFRFIGPESSKRLLVDAWGNPPVVAEGVLGMLYPADVNPVADTGWGVVVTYSESGYVDDKGAESIDYDKLMKSMKKEVEKGNKERVKQGYEPLHLVGWAEPPRYNEATHKLYWVKELDFEGSPQHTLNYSVRILGRRGVLVLDAVAGMDQLTAVAATVPSMLAFTDFNQGNRYADYREGVDPKAAFGIAGLIAGAAAAKAGLFKGLWLAILGLKKVLIVVVAAVAGFFKKIFGRKTARPGGATG